MAAALQAQRLFLTASTSTSSSSHPARRPRRSEAAAPCRAAPRAPSGLQASPAASAPAADLALKLDLCHDRARGLPSSRRSVATPPREAAAAQEQAVQELRLPRHGARSSGGSNGWTPEVEEEMRGVLRMSMTHGVHLSDQFFWERRSGMDGEAVGSLTFCLTFNLFA